MILSRTVELLQCDVRRRASIPRDAVHGSAHFVTN